MPVPHRADADVHIEPVVRRELLEVALAVRDEAELEAVRPQHLEGRQRVVVEEEVLVLLPLAHDRGRARARAFVVAAHAADDVLREADPEVLVVRELGMVLQVIEGGQSGRVVPLRDRAPGRAARRSARIPPAPARARPEEREVDVEQDSFQHGTEDTRGVRAVHAAA